MFREIIPVKWTQSWQCNRAFPQSQPTSQSPLWVFHQQWDIPYGDRFLEHWQFIEILLNNISQLFLRIWNQSMTLVSLDLMITSMKLWKLWHLLWLTIWSANPGRPGNGLHLYRLVELLSHRVAHCGAEKWQLALKLKPCSSWFMLKFGKKHSFMTSYWVYDHHKYLLRFLWLDPATASNFHTSECNSHQPRQTGHGYHYTTISTEKQTSVIRFPFKNYNALTPINKLSTLIRP